MNALQQAIERIAEGTPLRAEAEAELARLQAIESAAKKVVDEWNGKDEMYVVKQAIHDLEQALKG